MDDQSFNIRVPKKWARLALVVTVTALIVAPLTAIASHTFTDVPDTNTFHSDIDWLANAGITKGCNPPANTEFCPDDDVSRGQMSAFMRRFAQFIDAEDGTPAQADNATTADSATTAGDADTLDGLDSSDLLQADTIVTSYDGGMWLEHSFNAATVTRFIHQTQLSGGNGTMQLDLSAPNHIGDHAYGVSTIELCATGGGNLTLIQLWQTEDTTGSGVWTASDTPKVASGCTTYDVGLGGSRMSSGLVVQTSGSVNLFTTTVEWTTGAAASGLTDGSPSPLGGN